MKERGAGVSRSVELVRVLNEPPRDVPQWYADQFELKAT